MKRGLWIQAVDRCGMEAETMPDMLFFLAWWQELNGITNDFLGY